MPAQAASVEMDVATAFSVGCALGLILPDKSGNYVVYSSEEKVRGKLADEKLPSVILLTSDSKLSNALAADIQSDVSEKGSKEALEFLSSTLKQKILNRGKRTASKSTFNC